MVKKSAQFSSTGNGYEILKELTKIERLAESKLKLLFACREPQTNLLQNYSEELTELY